MALLQERRNSRETTEAQRNFIETTTNIHKNGHRIKPNADYPILVSSQTTIGTVGQDGGYSDVEAVVYNTNAPTVNPSTGAITAAGGFVGNATSADKVNHALYLGPYEYDGSADVVVGIYDGETE